MLIYLFFWFLQFSMFSVHSSSFLKFIDSRHFGWLLGVCICYIFLFPLDFWLFYFRWTLFHPELNLIQGYRISITERILVRSWPKTLGNRNRFAWHNSLMSKWHISMALQTLQRDIVLVVIYQWLFRHLRLNLSNF